MRSTYVNVGLAIASAAAPASAQLPIPPATAAAAQSDAFLFQAGAGDIFEITSGTMAQHEARSPEVKTFATMLIADHTNLTNAALGAAKAAGIAPPPPELSADQKDMLAKLADAGPAFDRTYLEQQLVAHQRALATMSAYAEQGDVPILRSAAANAVPVVRNHIAQVTILLRSIP